MLIYEKYAESGEAIGVLCADIVEIVSFMNLGTIIGQKAVEVRFSVL